MSSYNWLINGAFLIILVLFLAILAFIWTEDIEYRSSENLSEFLSGDIAEELYESKKENLDSEGFYCKMLNLFISISLYSGILIMIVGVYKRIDEHHKDLIELIKARQERRKIIL